MRVLVDGGSSSQGAGEIEGLDIHSLGNFLAKSNHKAFTISVGKRIPKLRGNP